MRSAIHISIVTHSRPCSGKAINSTGFCVARNSWIRRTNKLPSCSALYYKTEFVVDNLISYRIM